LLYLHAPVVSRRSTSDVSILLERQPLDAKFYAKFTQNSHTAEHTTVETNIVDNKQTYIYFNTSYVLYGPKVCTFLQGKYYGLR
jgi:hypothetical protein